MTEQKTTTRKSNRRQFMKTAGLTAGALFLAGRAPAYSAGTRKLRYIAFVNRESVWGKPYDFLAQEVDSMSGGELKIEYAGGGEVVSAFDAPETIANGVFDMCHTANSYFAGRMPSSISLASGQASVESLYASGALAAYDEILQAQHGLKLLGVPLSGVGYIFQVAGKPENLTYYKGKKIRSIPLYDAILEELGATPVTTSPAEAYTSMERGIVAGLGWPELGLTDFKFYEQAKYVMAPSFYQLRTATLINPNSFASLPEPLQQVLLDASKSADLIGATWTKEKRDAEYAEMAENGVEIVTLADAQAQQFVQMTEDKLWSRIVELDAEAGNRLKPLFDKAA
ncbi:MAG: TRAP transporter substrate-binding protein DctP [Rhodovibrionaceae bacterium]